MDILAGLLAVLFLVNKVQTTCCVDHRKHFKRRNFVSLGHPYSIVSSQYNNEIEGIHSGVVHTKKNIKNFHDGGHDIFSKKGDNMQKLLTPGWPHTADTCFVVAHRDSLISA